MLEERREVFEIVNSESMECILGPGLKSKKFQSLRLDSSGYTKRFVLTSGTSPGNAVSGGFEVRIQNRLIE
jgi:hypothetical protein